MVLYHGTNAKYLDSILQFGIRPRGEETGNYTDVQSSLAEFVYLTDRNPVWFSSKTFGDDQEKRIGTVLIVEVEVNEDALYPDEDYLRQDILRTTKTGDSFLASQLDPVLSRHRLREALEELGSVAHLGTISPSAIQRYALINISKGHQLLSQAVDVEQVTIENFALNKDRYQTITSFIFDGVPYQGRDLNHLWKHAIRVRRHSPD